MKFVFFNCFFDIFVKRVWSGGFEVKLVFEKDFDVVDVVVKVYFCIYMFYGDYLWKVDDDRDKCDFFGFCFWVGGDVFLDEDVEFVVVVVDEVVFS